MLAEVLRGHGVPVWYSPTNILSAQQWQDEIGKALRRCDWFLVLLSKHSVTSKWVKLELNYALSHSQYDDHILPVRLDNCDPEILSWTLDVFQRVDLNGSPGAAYAAILKTWGVGFDGTTPQTRRSARGAPTGRKTSTRRTGAKSLASG